MRRTLVIVAALLAAACAREETGDTDPLLWLEEVQGEEALDWVRAQNSRTFTTLRDHPLYETLYEEAFAILTSDARIPEGEIVGDDFHSFWQDETHVRGLWRRTSLASLVAGEPQWQPVLSIDALEAEEQQNWVYQGIDCLGGDSDRCLLELSRGGKDESVFREFSLDDGDFVANGFVVPEAKSYVAWANEDELLVGTDWGDGSLTASGYPRDVRRWLRGTPRDAATTLFIGESTDTLVTPTVAHTADGDYPFIVRLLADWNENEMRPVTADGVGEPLDIPLRHSFEGVVDGRAILRLEQDWQRGGEQSGAGDVVALDLASGAVETVFSPAAEQAVSAVGIGRSCILVELLDNVIGGVRRYRLDDGAWHGEAVPLPGNGVAELAATSSSRDDFLVTFESAVQPTTLYHVTADNTRVAVAAIDPLYDASGVVIRQQFATSADGTRVPYFLIGRQDVLERGNAPAILYGYGGFQIPVLPVYYENPSRPQHGALAGKLWISRGGVLALANLRGGGEFGPRWHQAALRDNRQRAFDDFFAIAGDMIARGITSRDRLGALGRSNGGLLLGVALTQRPDLFAALDIGVPLLDMRRYSQLLAGASWMGEYGNPDVAEDWDFIREYSPYQNLAAGTEYPEVLFYTSTLDDRVHPGHARKMAAKLEELGQDFLYYENIEGGHGGTANQQQLAMRTALEYAYFIYKLMPGYWRESAARDSERVE